MGKILKGLRDENIGSVVAFSLGGALNAANATQVAEALKSATIEGESVYTGSCASSVTIRNTSKESIPSPVEKR